MMTLNTKEEVNLAVRHELSARGVLGKCIFEDINVIRVLDHEYNWWCSGLNGTLAEVRLVGNGNPNVVGHLNAPNTAEYIEFRDIDLSQMTVEGYVSGLIERLTAYTEKCVRREQELTDKAYQLSIDPTLKSIRGCSFSIRHDKNYKPYLHIMTSRYGTEGSAKQYSYARDLSMFRSSSNWGRMKKWGLSYAIDVIKRLDLPRNEVLTEC